MKRAHQDSYHDNGGTSKPPESSSIVTGKSNIWQQQEDPSGGMDELLAVLGYKVRSSDMADVAQKLEHLEMVIGTTQDDDLSNLCFDTVHYNPSDLSSWLENMISGLNHPNVDHNRSIEDDLRAIPGVAAFPELESPLQTERTQKRMKIVNGFETESTRSVLVTDSEESGIRLVHTLMACAEAVERNNLQLADALVKHVGLLAVSQSGAMRKVATYFGEALARRIYRVFPIEPLDSDLLQMHFYESSPYLKFAHFTANQAILEAFANSNQVHVIDLGLKQGMQWPALLQALALRPGGPPSFRLTGIAPPQPDNSDSMQEVGLKLAQLAKTIGVEFKFRGFMVNSLADLEPSMLEILSGDDETVAVNSIFELHGLLSRPGAIDSVLASIKRIKPKIFTIVEQEANHNEPGFLPRFTEALHYYSNLFDSLEGTCSVAPPIHDRVMSEVYLGRQICNVVACEGTDRVERHESLTRWRTRMSLAGFDPVHLGSNAFKQASMLLALFGGGDAYGVVENNGCLMLGWHSRPLIATSAWQLAADSV